MEALLIHQDESDSIVDKLEEYGLNENEYELLKVLYKGQHILWIIL